MSFLQTSRHIPTRVFAVLVVLAASGLLYSCDSKREPVSQKADAQAVVLFAIGDVKVNSRSISPGDIIHTGDLVQLKDRSTCDLQFQSPHSGLVVRLANKTEFLFSARAIQEVNRLNLELNSGNALIDVQKLEKNQEVQMVAPAAVAAVRGTRFEVDVNEEGSATTRVFEGKVAVRTRIPEAEDLPPEVIESSEVLTQTIQSLEKKEVVLEEGKQTTISAEQSRELLAGEPELKEVLASEEIASIRNVQVDREKGKQAGHRIDELLENKNKSAQDIKSNLEKSPLPAPEKVEPISEPEMKKKLEQYEELISIDQNRLKNEKEIRKAVQERNQEQRANLQKRIEKIFDKKSETLILRGGRKIHGVIYQQGSDYVVLTVEGKKHINGKDVEGFAF